MKAKLIISTLLILLISTVSFSKGKDISNAVTMVSYEQSWLDNEGTLALKNNTNSYIYDVTFQITYLNMSGEPLNYEVYTRKVEIAPGMTKQTNIPAYEYGRSFSYYKSEAAYDSPHKFKIKFELKGYNQDTQTSKSDETYGSSIDAINPDNSKDIDRSRDSFYSILMIPLAIGVIGLAIGIYVLVAYMAKERNRSQALWVLIAIITTPILAIIILLCIGNSYDNYRTLD